MSQARVVSLHYTDSLTSCPCVSSSMSQPCNVTLHCLPQANMVITVVFNVVFTVCPRPVLSLLSSLLSAPGQCCLYCRLHCRPYCRHYCLPQSKVVFTVVFTVFPRPRSSLLSSLPSSPGQGRLRDHQENPGHPQGGKAALCVHSLLYTLHCALVTVSPSKHMPSKLPLFLFTVEQKQLNIRI